MNTLLRCAMTVAAIGLSVGRVNADTVTWVGPASGGNWSDAANWKCESATYTDPIEMMQKGVEKDAKKKPADKESK